MQGEELKVLYVTSFNLRLYSGKNRATKQKAEAILQLCPGSIVVSATNLSPIIKYVAPILVELVAISKILKCRPDVVISRGPFGLLMNLIARITGAVTVREVHAAGDEASLITANPIKQFAINLSGKYSSFITKKADIRIFNHPNLLQWYRKNVYENSNDFFCYNGGSLASASILSREQAINCFNLDPKTKYLVFTGSAAKWHGVDYLIGLQAEFDRNKDPIKVVVGGGNISSYDRAELCLNVTPLDDRACSNLIRAASLCMLPVKDNRVSPGSPLKLYDYMLCRRYIVTQKEVNGYSDEVLGMQVGCCVDYNDPVASRNTIVEYLSRIDGLDDGDYPEVNVTWEDRVSYWLRMIANFRSSKSV